MKYLVIGLGNLGRAIAESLTRIGNEVNAVFVFAYSHFSHLF